MKKSTRKLWSMPMLMAALMLYGLISALALEGRGDVVACLVLSIPVVILIYYYYFQAGRQKR